MLSLDQDLLSCLFLLFCLLILLFPDLSTLWPASNGTLDFAFMQLDAKISAMMRLFELTSSLQYTNIFARSEKEIDEEEG